MMASTADYSAVECLRDGSTIEIRALRPDDQDDMLAAVNRTSVQSLQRRFFVPKRGFSDKEVAFFMNIDFISHVALVAQIDEDGRPLEKLAVTDAPTRRAIPRPSERRPPAIIR